MIMENNDRFSNKTSCHLVGSEKAEALALQLWRETGVPTQVTHRCVTADVEL
jgi:hypothetical protein